MCPARPPGEVRADRSAHEPPGHDANHRGGDRERSGARHAGGFELGSKRESGGGPTGERDRSREHAHQRVLPEQRRDAGADHVLQERHHRREEKEHDHGRTANAQQRHARAEPDRREERDHQGRLQRRVELDRILDVRPIQGQKDRDEQAADDGCGDVVFGERRDDAADEIAGKQHDTREGDGLN